MIVREFANLARAVEFLTRIPVPQAAIYDPAWLATSAKYFSLVGAFVGATGAAVILLTSIVCPQPLPIVLGLLSTIIVSGALHEDGLADSADGLIGGATAARRLEIMKDSRIGVFGVLAIVAILAIKFASLQALDPVMSAWSLVAASSCGRFAAVAVMTGWDYAGDRVAAKTSPLSTPLSRGSALVAFAVFIAVGLITLPPLMLAMCAIVGLTAALLVAAASKRLIGGYTGDVLGCVVQVCEAGFLCAAAAIIAGPG